MFSLFLISVRVLQTCVFFRLFLSVICISYVAVQLLAVWCSSFIEERPIRCSPHIHIRTCCFEDLIVLFDPQTVGKLKIPVLLTLPSISLNMLIVACGHIMCS